ncbi:MAG: chromosome segregation protein SMC [Desulfobacterales bacterium]|nr:chromosome segregation protein SMC [Desulfobacterales bacterium]
MKLRKLEISGFKSFHEKASIKFPQGVSAIVGPNGCGKSNVVDALRWVMGEQSVKQLRGKSMEDIIFAGTNGHAPLNMAEVSLTLLNDNGSAPEELRDYTEIMLTRRLYRSGESAYFLNKQPCRLKDIHNVFLGSGMGAKSYSVIQQGNIGAITDAGPEERRIFIEEAAGITRYKVRKKEALQKVNATNRNLTRLKDIIVEVKRQMDGLKRQAKRAEYYKKFQERIRILDIHLSVNKYDIHSKKFDETTQLLTDLKDSDLKHSSEIKRLDAAVEEIKLNRWQKNQEISNQKNRKFEMQRNIDRIENDLAHYKTETERLLKEIAELETAHLELDEKSRRISEESLQLKEQSAGFESQLIEIKSRIIREQAESQDFRDNLAKLNRSLENCKKNLMDLVAEEAKYKNIFQTASNNKENLKRRLKRVDEEEVLAKNQVAAAEKKEAEVKDELSLIKNELEALAEEITEIQTSIQEKNRLLRDQIKLVQTTEHEYNKRKSKYGALKKMEDNFEWYKGGVKAIMQKHTTDTENSETDQPEKDNIRGLVADIIEPAPSYETAVEAALGEALQYVLIKDTEIGIESIDYLQANSAGRSGFIPVSTIKPVSGDGHNGPDADKLLLNHVAVKSGYENISKALLGHVAVTENMAEAIALFNKNGACQTVVTKNGDVITYQGIMLGGSKDNLSGILVKKQELKALEKEIAKLSGILGVEQKKQYDLETVVKNLEIDHQKLIERRNITSRDETEAEKELFKASEGLKHSRRHLEIAQLEQEQLLNEESDIDDEVAKYNNTLAKIENDVKEAQTDVVNLTGQVESSNLKMAHYDQKIVELKLKQTNLNASWENTRSTLHRLEEYYNDGVRQLEQMTQDISHKKSRVSGGRDKNADTERKLAAMYEDFKKLDGAIERNESAYQAIDSELKKNDDVISNIQTQREKTLEKIRLLEIEQTQQGMKRESIENNLFEKYNDTLSNLKLMITEKMADNERSDDQLTEELGNLRKKIERIGEVNMSAINEYEAHKSRFDFLCEQRDDLHKAINDLDKVIKKINKISEDKFLDIFEQVNEKIQAVFPKLFEGGSARLLLTDPDNPLETGVEFMIHPPGKKLTRMSLLSGGEKALSAIAFIFSIFLLKPASFCLLDEIDAPLDEANVFRFNNLLKMIGEKSQIVMITHNKNSMEFADTLFGITMEKKGISKVVSVNLERADA